MKREEGRKREKEGEAQQRSSHNACLTTGCGDSEANMSTTLEADRNLVEAQIQVPQEGDAIVRHRLQQRGKNAPLGKSVLVSTQVTGKYSNKRHFRATPKSHSAGWVKGAGCRPRPWKNQWAAPNPTANSARFASAACPRHGSLPEPGSVQKGRPPRGCPQECPCPGSCRAVPPAPASVLCATGNTSRSKRP